MTEQMIDLEAAELIDLGQASIETEGGLPEDPQENDFTSPA